MNSDIRASIAYIAGVIISKNEGTIGVHDHDLSLHKKIFGDIDNQRVDVHDYDLKCEIFGDKVENGFNLFHHG